MPPTITIVRDTNSTLTPTLVSRNDPAAGVIVAMPRSGMRSLGWLASDLLTAMGMNTGRSYGADGWPIAVAHLIPWVVAKDIRHLVVGYAETLSTNNLATLAQLSQLTETSLWLVADMSFTDALAGFDRDFGTDSIDSDELDEHLTPVPSGGTEPPPSEQIDAVPDDIVLTFLATARKTLPADAYRHVLARYVEAFDSTAGWLTTQDEAPDENVVAGHLNDLVHGQRTLAAVTTTIRGMQAAALRHGLLIKVSARHYLNRMQDTRTALDLTADEWNRLDNHGTTRQGAIAVLAALGIPVNEIVDIHADQVRDDGSTIRTAERLHDVPEPARYLLQAQLLYRACAADPNNPKLLAGSRKDADMNVRGISLAIDSLARTSGIAFRARHDEWNSTAVQWRQRSGISVTELAA